MKDSDGNDDGTNIQKFDPSSFEKEHIPYTLISNEVIQKIDNIQAGFIWIYLQSLPPKWKPNKFHIMSHFQISERSYQRLMAYLCDCGLIEYDRKRNKRGTLGTTVMKVLNGSKFISPVDNFFSGKKVGGVVIPLKPAPDKVSNHTAKFGGVVRFNHTAKKPHSGDLAAFINTIITSTEEIKENPPISPQGGSKLPFSFSQILDDNPHAIPESMISDWLEVRKAKKAKITATAWKSTNSVLLKLSELGLNPVDCFETMVASGWQGMKVNYFQREIDNLAQKQRVVSEEKIRERELQAEESKRKELADSRGEGFKSIVAKIKTTHAERIAVQEAERISLGMTVIEYHDHITKKPLS